ncbi:MAG: arylesterase [Rubrivivax sp.]|nr:MAG: arylesterase [Rubrivivax sp.]
MNRLKNPLKRRALPHSTTSSRTGLPDSPASPWNGQAVESSPIHRRHLLGAAAGAAWLLSLGLGVNLGLGSAAWAAAGKAAASGRPATILILGDSLSAEYGLARGTGWVALLEKRLATSRPGARVVNASISGETTSGGAARLPALLSTHRPTHVVIELGANDALRGLPLKGARQTLDRMVRASQAAGAQVLLVGMMVPPNFGKRYADEFAAIYPAVAKDTSAAVAPFFLKGVADRPDARDWFQADGIHPLARAHATMLDNVWPALARLL